MIKRIINYSIRILALKPILSAVIRPTLMKVILRDVFGVKYKQHTNKEHIEAAVGWLCRSQDEFEHGGSAGSYAFAGGWADPYPETSGYIISTFLNFADFTDDKSYVERAKKMGDWEICIQMPSGAVRGGSGINDYPIVFNTGMVILGWTDLYKYNKDERYLAASKKAADWLCENMDADGKWSKYTYLKIPHAYHSRVTWSVLKVYKLTNNEKYKDAAVNSINWLLSLVKEDGWINEMHMIKGENPLTHTIAYTLRGLIECAALLDGELKDRIQNIVIQASTKLMEVYEQIINKTGSNLKFLAARYDNKWNKSASYSCLTGNAQMSIIWLKIYQLNKDSRYFQAAEYILSELKKVHSLSNSNLGIRGAIAGSYPVYGKYMQFSYPNWAPKFYADALILLQTIKDDIA